MLPNIQRNLVPRRPSTRYGHVEVAHLWEPLDEIGGDFLYYEKVCDRYLSLEIGDVTGHGTEAGLVMTALHGLFFGQRQRSAAPDQMLADANAFLCRLRNRDSRHDANAFVQHMMCSMFLLRLDLETGVLAYCNAGHPAALYLAHGTEGPIISLQSGGPILGVLDEAKYQASQMRPAAGDTLLVFTDGLSEAANAADEEFGSERLQRLLESLHTVEPREIVQRVSRAVGEFRATAPTTDDVAMAVMQFGSKWSPIGRTR
jgi:phosphoserine phosphatase RsbU/P